MPILGQGQAHMTSKLEWEGKTCKVLSRGNAAHCPQRAHRTVRPEPAKTQNELFHFLQQFHNLNREEISEKQNAEGILGQTLLLFEILYVLCD